MEIDSIQSDLIIWQESEETYTEIMLLARCACLEQCANIVRAAPDHAMKT